MLEPLHVMQPYYDDGSCVIYHGDCREILPTLKADALVTDPPYGLDEKWQGGGGKGKSSWAFDPTEATAWDHSLAEGVEDLPKVAP